MNQYKRIFLIVLDSLGVGEASDALMYGDFGSNTLGHIAQYRPLNVPTLISLNIGSLGSFQYIPVSQSKNSYTARLEEISTGKDTMTGHWEMMGLEVKKPFQTFSEKGFPLEFIRQFEQKTGRRCVGNYAESGTKIIDDWGEHQMATGDWIVYTSADSVFQIAAHEDIISLDELYQACEIARELTLDDRWKIGRIIARPYKGEGKGRFIRTSNRRDYALSPLKKTVLDYLQDSHYDVIGVGKIPDIFNHQGITQEVHTTSNTDGMNKTIELSKNHNLKGLIFTNLVDFDALYGHRRNIEGYAQAIESFDVQLKQLMNNLNKDDLLIITADHGNDPSFKGTDHTRENVPLIIYNTEFKHGRYLGLLKSYAVIGATIADNFQVTLPTIGFSIMEELK